MAAFTTTPTIRPLRPHDDALFGATANTRSGIGTQARSPALPRVPEPFGDLTLATFASYALSGCSYVAEVDGQLVGYLFAQPISYHDGTPLTIWVDAIAVHPNHRRQQIGIALYHALGAWARTVGVKAILTRVDPDNLAAARLHRRVDFERHGTGAIVWRLEGE